MTIDNLVPAMTFRQLADFTRSYGTLDEFAKYCSNVEFWERQIATARSDNDRAYARSRMRQNIELRDACLAILVELMGEFLYEHPKEDA